LHAEPPVFTFGSEMGDAANAVDMPENEMAAKFLSGGERLLQIHSGASL